MNVYTPGLDRIIHSTSADFNKRTLPRPVHIVQYDDGIPILAVTLYLDGNQYTIPANAEMNIRFGKKDGTFVYNPALGCSSDRHIVYFEITQQMTVFRGRFEPIVEVVIGGDVAGSGCLDIEIDRNPIQEGDIESSTEFITIQEYASRAETAANNAETSEQNAAQSKNNAATSATNAGNSASAAAISAEEAANTDIGLLEASLSDNKIYQTLKDSSDDTLLDSSGNLIEGTVIFVNAQEAYDLKTRINTLETLIMSIFSEMSPNQISVLFGMIGATNENVSLLETYAILDSDY